jgi:putative inorganic carbon (hco3(-)) transporter
LTERLVWRPPWYVWVALALAIVAVIHVRVPGLLHGDSMPMVLLGAVAAVLLAMVLWEQPPAMMMCAAIVLTVFSGDWGELGIPGVPLDRIAMAAVVLALLLRAPGAARVPRLRVKAVHLLLALVVLYVTASAAVSGTLFTETGFLKLFDNLGVVPYLMLLLAPAIFAGQREREMLLKTLIVLGAYLGLTAIFEAIGPKSLVFPHFIAEVGTETGFEQAAGPFKEPITEGFACFACGVAAVIATYQLRTRGWRWFAGVVAVISVVGCFSTLERGVWIAATAGLLAAMLAEPRLRRWLIPAAVTCVVVIGGALLVSPTLSEHATARAEDKVSVWDRENQTATALRMIAAHPLLGVGWDKYTSDSLEYFRQSPTYPMTGFSDRNIPLPLHDSYLAFAVEIGLVGALLWVISLVWGIGGAIALRVPEALRPWRLGLIAIGVFFCVLAAFDPLQQPFTMILLWVWAGVVMSSGVGGLPKEDRRAGERDAEASRPGGLSVAEVAGA